ncbi:MAG: hypothetical protein L0Y58_25840 [Verrucomicrobia subdivision 3 bacterium]|nr:hypothetical protein [Limisphaerales bacterium]
MPGIDRIGLELEGGWDVRPPSTIKSDGSVDVCASYVGEIVSPPLKPGKCQAGCGKGRIARRLNELAVTTKTGAGKIIHYKLSPRWPEGRIVITKGKWQSGNVARVLNSNHTRRILVRGTGERAI